MKFYLIIFNQSIILKKFLFLLIFIVSVQSIYAQATFEVQIKTDAVNKLASRFYVEGVIDARKDPINNGYALDNKKKANIVFPGGTSNQLQQYFNALLPVADTSILAVQINIKKLVLTERPTSRGTIAKAELTIQFFRKYNEELTQLYELNTWMEQSALKDASKLQEKNIRDILSRMMVQFNQLIADHPEDPLLAPQIKFSVIHPPDDKLMDDTIYW